ncbi:hypothetical protein [uncultured Roseobacter sp.]|uniref:hypothetical protein n=1 Tax=uncultured Roseobacter sp. TaxID=114847 RepID=UPI00262981F7|nr:hypothetical protein [uncultured Roseobacter sp.]
MMRAFTPFIVFFLWTAQGFALCFGPSFYESPPTEPYSGAPNIPYCLSEYSYSGRHSCDDWELQSYIDEVDQYIFELNQYVSEYQGFAIAAAEAYEDAGDYAECLAAEATELFN